MKFKLSILFCGFLLISHAQDHLDIVNLSYTNTPSNNFEISEAKTTIEEVAINLTFPIVLNDKTTVLTGFNGNKTTLDLDANSLNTSLNSLSINLGINKIFNQKWSGTFLLIPKIASNDLSLSNRDLQLGILSLFTNKKSQNLKYKFGIYANTENYGVLIVPILGLYYLSKNSTFEANLNLPINAELNYKIFKKTWAGLRFDGLGSTYNIHGPIYNRNNAYVVKTSNELFSYLRFQLTKSIYLNTKIGYSIGRSYKVYDSNDKVDLAITSIYLGDNRTQLNENFDNGLVFKVELFYRFHFK